MTNRFLLLAAAAALLPVSAMAQSAEKAADASDNLVCQLSGDCADATAGTTDNDKPETRGFSIARSGGKAAPAPVAVANSRQRMIPAATPRPAEAGRMMAAPARAASKISFVPGSAMMTGEGKAEALRFLGALKSPQLAGKRFQVSGHTDASGNAAANLRLSQQRAQSVVDFLVANGASAGQLAAKGFGSQQLIDTANPNSPANRRVEFVRVN